MAKIYTKVGDQGRTGLVGGQKVMKSEARIEAYGTIDELNAFLGLARAAIHSDEIKAKAASEAKIAAAIDEIDEQLETIQHWLFDFGSLLAALPTDWEKYKLPLITESHVQWLEKKIDASTVEMPALKEFILPGGSELAARLHIARTVSRRAERLLVALQEAATTEMPVLPEQAIPFINRLSDYFFTMARYANFKLGHNDVAWKQSTPA